MNSVPAIRALRMDLRSVQEELERIARLLLK